MEGDRPPHGHPQEQVVIVGGGFGGLYTALALTADPRHPPVLLIEPGERFVFLPLLYELLSDELRGWEIAPRYDRLLAGRGVAWLQDRVERIDLDRRTVHTRGGRSLSYARLVLATGAQADHFGVPGAERHTLGFRSLADVEALQRLMAELVASARPLQRLAIVGAGPTGVELACKLADLAAGSVLVELIEQGPSLLPRSPAFNREQAERALRRRDVRLRTGTLVTAVEPDHLLLRRHGDGAQAVSEPLPTRGVIWTAGLRSLPPAMTPEPTADSRGRLACEPDLRLRDHDDVFVVGDLAAALPATAQVAFQQAPLVAANLRRSLAGQPLEPFVWKDLGEMMSLGRGDACLTGSGLTLAGPAAFQVRRLAYLTRLPGLQHQLRVAAGWLADAAA
jgi:NADH:ubiquinone reductase (non-electrogenic)